MRDSISLISTESKAVTPSSNDLMHYLTNFLHAASHHAMAAASKGKYS